MSRAAEPRTSVVKGSIEYIGKDGTITVPVFVYRKYSEIRQGGVEFHKYHRDCDTRINYKDWCPSCEQIVFPTDVEKRADSGGEAVSIDRAQLKSVVKGEDSTIRILGTIPLKEVPVKMKSGVFAFNDVLVVRGFKIGTKKKEVMPSAERQLRLLLDSLGKNQEAMYVLVPLTSGARYGLLFPSGDLYTLVYEEELRADIEWNYGPGEGYARGDLTVLAKFLKGKEMSVDSPPSMQGTLKKVDDILTAGEVTPPGAIPEDGPAGVISIGEALKQLKTMGEKVKQ